MLSNGLKEDIVLKEPLPAAHPGRFRFQLAVQGATPVAIDNGRAVSFRDGQGQELARIPRGTMVDANGVESAVDMHLVEQNGSWFVDVAPDLGYLRSADRAYPVRVDPSFQVGSWTTDTFVDSIATTTNYNGGPIIKAGWSNGIISGGSAEYYSYLRFPDLTVIRDKAVTNGELKVTNTYSIDPQNKGLTAFRTKGTWNASTLTWANKPNHSGTERVDINANQQLYSFNVTSWAQGWAAGQDGETINGKWSPYGVTINTAGEAAYYELGAAEDGFLANRPELSITYINQTPNLITTMSPTDGWVGTASPPLTAVFSDPDDTNGKIEYKVDGELWGPFTTINGSTAPIFGLGPGTHTWQVRGIDANSAGPWSSLRSFTINSLPNVPDQLSPSDGFLAAVVTPLTARFYDPDGQSGGTLEFEISGVGTLTVGSLNNGAVGSVTPPIELSPGTYSWRVRSKDSAGSYSIWSGWRTMSYYPRAEWVRDEYPNNGALWDVTKWTTSSSVTVSGNQGFFPISTSSKRATATGPLLADSEVSLTYAFPNRTAGTSLRVTLRGGPGTDSSQLANGYRLDIPSGSRSLTVNKVVAGTVSQLGSFSDSDDPLDSNPRRLRFRVEGVELHVKTWPLGALEPIAWDAVVPDLDGSITDPGTLQIANAYQSAGRSATIDDVTYSTALLPSSIVHRVSAQGPGGDVITCTADTDRPHKSKDKRFRGVVNIHAWADCRHSDGTHARVPYLELEARLYRNDQQASEFPSVVSDTNRYSLDTTSHDKDGCVSNEAYQGWVRVKAKSPPDYSPAETEASGFNTRPDHIVVFQC